MRVISDPEKYWNEMALKFRDSPKALGWSSRQRQEKRFDVLSKVIEDKEGSILDMGCGMGDLFTYLRKIGWNGSYTGIDISQEMVNISRQKIPYAKIIKGDISEADYGKHDYVLLSGTLNNRLYEEERDQYACIQKIIENMWEASGKAMAFNLRSGWGQPPRSEDIFAYNPISILEMCRTLTTKLIFNHSYFPHDFTIFMFRGEMV